MRAIWPTSQISAAAANRARPVMNLPLEGRYERGKEKTEKRSRRVSPRTSHVQSDYS
jgi:hypothetical protein